MPLGANRVSLHLIYGEIIRTKTEYGFTVYGSTRTYIYRSLNTIHHTIIRICDAFSVPYHWKACMPTPMDHLYPIYVIFNLWNFTSAFCSIISIHFTIFFWIVIFKLLFVRGHHGLLTFVSIFETRCRTYFLKILMFCHPILIYTHAAKCLISFIHLFFKFSVNLSLIHKSSNAFL